MRFFFYGTLMDADVRRAVLGRRREIAVGPATLHGWRRVALAHESYPIIVRDSGGTVEGLLARGLDAAARARLCVYEGPDYELTGAVVHTAAGAVDAHVFVPAPGWRPEARGDWDLAAWQRAAKRSFLARLNGARRGPAAVSCRRWRS